MAIKSKMFSITVREQTQAQEKIKKRKKESQEGKIVKALSDKGVARSSLRKRVERGKNEKLLELCSNVGTLSTSQAPVPKTPLCSPEGLARIATALKGVACGLPPGTV